MKSTQRYGIEYPAPTDLVSGASDQFERMANSMEKAMAGVDDRVIQNATLPVVRGTLAELNSAQGVDGQTGLVTQETDNVTAYVRQGTSWLALCTRAWHETLKTAVTAVQNAVSTLTTRVTTAEQNIGQRVTTSTFNSKVTDLQNQVNALNTPAYAIVRRHQSVDQVECARRLLDRPTCRLVLGESRCQNRQSIRKRAVDAAEIGSGRQCEHRRT